MTSTPPTPTADPSAPLELAHGPAWTNRYALAPMTNKQSNTDGTLGADEHTWLVARGRGGFGAVTTCAAYVADTGRTWTGQLGISSPDHLPGLTHLAQRLKDAGTTALIQLHHGGLRADPELAGPLLAPFDDPRSGATAMTTAQVHQLVDDHVAAALRAETAGFHGVQIHAAHGFVLAQFLDRRNQRSDGYGGPLDDRTTVLTEVLTGIRAATGPDFQLGVRLDPHSRGTTLDESREITGQVLTSGVVDVVDMSLKNVYATHDDDRLVIEDFTALPRPTTALSVAGQIHSPTDARWCLQHGADAVSIGTGAVLHHDFARRALADPDFAPRPRPVNRDVLTGEYVGPALMDYLATGWDDLVA